jgi:hypothetical protein
MTLNKHEEELLTQIARGLERDDRALARKLRSGGAPTGQRLRWLVITPIATGLALAAAGMHWDLPACIAIGIVCATVGPIIVGLLLAPRPH